MGNINLKNVADKKIDLIKEYLEPASITITELIDRNAYASLCQLLDAYLLEAVRNKNYNQDKLDLRDQHLSIIKNGIRIGQLEIVDCKIKTSGIIGDNHYNSFIELIKGLQGLDIKIDEFYW